LPIPGINSDEYLNGKLPFVCCLESIFDDGLLVTLTRRMVSSLVVVDDDVDEDDECVRIFLGGLFDVCSLGCFRDG
jgi:hypothetical protein